MSVIWRAFPLHPDTPEEGLSLEELFKGRLIDINDAMERLKKTAEELGLPLSERKKTFNSRLAQELGKWAESEGRGDDCHNAIFKAYFVDGKNIAKMGILIELAENMGLSSKIAQEVLEKRSFKGEVDQDWSLANSKGIRAVPTFVFNDKILVGAQPYDNMRKFIEGKD